ncbi:uncharacterized protein LOC115004623 [Cottoperca gobio]|uniref:Uncharacterized protein LOC115004623 n=1 Tax=Cottoperca gobio TaxID=56716 RepID=A0A6J2P9G9_COTGO|nr:uncharacterized protein LOC115004623 [Cottoperca gobio]
MQTAALLTGLLFICKFTEKAEGRTEGFVDADVQSACRDRYLWIHVTSAQTPQFEAVDGNGVHSISELLASHCGYTISTFKMDGFTTLRASYYSCFTHNQNDEVFTFRFNVIVKDAGGERVRRPVSAVCSGLMWTHREMICEEDYMEVNVNRESSCGGQRGGSGQVWQAAFSQAQGMASSVWQLMFLHSDGRVSSMSTGEAQRGGYSLTSTARRVVLRSRYKRLHSELTMVEGVPVEVVRVSLFFRQKLTVVLIDVSMACTVNTGSFDGARLLLDVPRVVTPLVGEGAKFESRSLSLGVDGVLLDKATAETRGFSLVQQGNLVQVGVPFGTEGGYRKSLVVDNVYKETYVIFLLYEHVFSLIYEDGSSIDSRHRMLRVLNTPLRCRPPFDLNQTISDHQMFRVYLGNIPADVVLEEVRINGKSENAGRTYSISPVVHINGSRAYALQLPFTDSIVHWMYLGQGVVQYSIDINFTLTIMPQRDSYYHHTFITAQALNAFPPEVTAQCSDGGTTFSIVRPPRGASLWEVGVDHEPLTAELVAQRGYRLHSDSHRTNLQVPVFSIGYTYEGINLSNFYGTFELLLRDSKSLEVQTSTSKRCLFKTEDMIVCSADGTMTVVTTPTSTWPTVQPEGTTLLDPTCGPKQTDGSRVLFEFKIDSCGTRAMAGELYMVYENEVLHDRQLIADGPNFISRESQFKLTVRCFYPLSGVNRLSLFKSKTPGFGSVKVFESLKADSANKLPAKACPHQVSGNAVPTNQVYQSYQTPAAGRVLPHSDVRPWPKPGPSRFITVPAGNNKRLYSSQNLKGFPNFYLSPPPEEKAIGTQQIPLQVLAPPGHLISQTQDKYVFESPNNHHLPNVPPRNDQLPDNSVQTLNFNFVQVSGEGPGPTDEKQTLSPSNRIPESPVVEQLESDWGSSSQALYSDNVWQSQSEKKYIPANAKLITSKNTLSDLSKETDVSASTEPTSTATSRVNQNLERPGIDERRNIETVQSRVQNIRVKPLSKFVSSGHQLNQKPVIQQANSQIYNPSQYATGSIAGGNSRASQHLAEHRGSTLGRKQHGFWTLYPNQQEHQQKLVQSEAEKGNGGGKESTQQTGASHIRVRLVSSLSGLQTHHEPNPESPTTPSDTRGATSGTSYLSVTDAVDVGQYQPNNPPAGGAVSGSDQTHTGPDCGGQYGTSVHQGIIRGKQIS